MKVEKIDESNFPIEDDINTDNSLLIARKRGIIDYVKDITRFYFLEKGIFILAIMFLIVSLVVFQAEELFRQFPLVSYNQAVIFIFVYTIVSLYIMQFSYTTKYDSILVISDDEIVEVSEGDFYDHQRYDINTEIGFSGLKNVEFDEDSVSFYGPDDKEFTFSHKGDYSDEIEKTVIINKL